MIQGGDASRQVPDRRGAGPLLEKIAGGQSMAYLRLFPGQDWDGIDRIRNARRRRMPSELVCAPVPVWCMVFRLSTC